MASSSSIPVPGLTSKTTNRIPLPSSLSKTPTHLLKSRDISRGKLPRMVSDSAVSKMTYKPSMLSRPNTQLKKHSSSTKISEPQMEVSSITDKSTAGLSAPTKQSLSRLAQIQPTKSFLPKVNESGHTNTKLSFQSKQILMPSSQLKRQNKENISPKQRSPKTPNKTAVIQKSTQSGTPSLNDTFTISVKPKVLTNSKQGTTNKPPDPPTPPSSVKIVSPKETSPLKTTEIPSAKQTLPNKAENNISSNSPRTEDIKEQSIPKPIFWVGKVTQRTKTFEIQDSPKDDVGISKSKTPKKQKSPETENESLNDTFTICTPKSSEIPSPKHKSPTNTMGSLSTQQKSSEHEESSQAENSSLNNTITISSQLGPSPKKTFPASSQLPTPEFQSTPEKMAKLPSTSNLIPIKQERKVSFRTPRSLVEFRENVVGSSDLKLIKFQSAISSIKNSSKTKIGSKKESKKRRSLSPSAKHSFMSRLKETGGKQQIPINSPAEPRTPIDPARGCCTTRELEQHCPKYDKSKFSRTPKRRSLPTMGSLVRGRRHEQGAGGSLSQTVGLKGKGEQKSRNGTEKVRRLTKRLSLPNFKTKECVLKEDKGSGNPQSDATKSAEDCADTTNQNGASNLNNEIIDREFIEIVQKIKEFKAGRQEWPRREIITTTVSDHEVETPDQTELTLKKLQEEIETMKAERKLLIEKEHELVAVNEELEKSIIDHKNERIVFANDLNLLEKERGVWLEKEKEIVSENENREEVIKKMYDDNLDLNIELKSTNDKLQNVERENIELKITMEKVRSISQKLSSLSQSINKKSKPSLAGKLELEKYIDTLANVCNKDIMEEGSENNLVNYKNCTNKSTENEHIVFQQLDEKVLKSHKTKTIDQLSKNISEETYREDDSKLSKTTMGLETVQSCANLECDEENWKQKAENYKDDLNFLEYIINSYNIVKIDGII